eukprot:s770_g14.t1
MSHEAEDRPFGRPSKSMAAPPEDMGSRSFVLGEGGAGRRPRDKNGLRTMLPNCTADLAAVFSPQRREPEASERAPKVIVDDRFFFRRLTWALHRRAVRHVRAVPPCVRLSVELLLLVASLIQLSAVLVLHAALLPSALSPLHSDPLAERLTDVVSPSGTAAELLIIELALPSFGSVADDIAPNSSSVEVVCEVAAERSVLELPPALRRGVQEAASEQHGGLVAKVHMDANELHPMFPVHRLPSSLLRGILVSRILGALVTGPLRDEVIRREPFLSVLANFTEEVPNLDGANNSSEVGPEQPAGAKVPPMAVEKWSLLAWGLAEVGLGIGNVSTAKLGSTSLAFLSCEGQTPVSLQPLRRLSELLDRRTEWWLFKTVWVFATCIFGLLAAVVVCFAVRGSLLGLYSICLHLSTGPGCGLLDSLEATVLVLAPAGLGFAFCRLAGTRAPDVAAILLCLSAGEVASLMLQTQDSRYLFPRAALPAYVADVYYCFFYHPMNFTGLAHGALFCYQAFLVAVLWGHFETVVRLPTSSLDQLNVEVRIRPSSHAKGHAQLSPAVQKLLLEQGLLLLGDNTSYETGMVMSAVVSRAVQTMKAPRWTFPTDPVGATDLLHPGESLRPIHPEALGGGAAVHLLFSRAFAGDARSGAVLAQLTERMRKSVQWLPYITAQTREITFSIARQNLVEQLRARRREVPEEE